ncbi:hypothetical protein NPS01_09630 [Nocardioides psychrotolerans]|uniref:glycosyl hydrolase family 18 protein n=1 Tax=Nocardioides psychrotolerans TaxID=1005945 RepID=UPI001197EE9E|nr:glycosyl hydrolase family 18 protein [Nocardioides psychrotolerans]GEP37300.1 hypothetical protein NPS01_09630 [Nocardioides psychrotolerans]
MISLLTAALATVLSVSGLSVTGFALGSATDRLVAENARGLTTVSVAGVSITADGAWVARPTADVRRLAGTARREGLRSELLLSNYSNRQGGFDARAAHLLLSNPAHIDRVATRMAGFVRAQGWSGVNVDLELVRRQDADELVRLVRALQSAMPEARTVSIDVSASTSLTAFRGRGYKLGALGRAADTVVLMTYDLHGPSWSGPGPIGPTDWQRRAVTAALEAVPASRLDLGVAGYGYTWPSCPTARSSGGPTGAPSTVASPRPRARPPRGRPLATRLG